MAKVKAYAFTVVGTGAFPTDMLRYDAAYPTDHTNVNIAPYRETSEYYRVHRSVNLRSPNMPTVERWRSFGWKVENIQARSY